MLIVNRYFSTVISMRYPKVLSYRKNLQVEVI